MAVNISLLNSSNTNNINTNFQRVATALQDVVGRSGTLPNQMNADFDLNGNDVLNVGTLQADDVTIDGDSVAGVLTRAEEAVIAAELAAAEAATSAAQAAQGAGKPFNNKATAQAFNPLPAADPSFIEIAGYTTPGDGGDALYVKDVGVPAHTGYIQIASGGVFSLQKRIVNLKNFGFDSSDVTGVANTNALNEAIDYLKTKQGGEIIIPGEDAIFGSSSAEYSFPYDLTITGQAGNRIRAKAGFTGAMLVQYARRVFYQVATPTGANLNDLWFDQPVTSPTLGTARRFNGSTWDVIVADGDDIYIKATLETNGLNFDCSNGVDVAGQKCSAIVAAYYRNWNMNENTGYGGTNPSNVNADSFASPIAIYNFQAYENDIAGFADVAYYVGGDNKIGKAAGDGATATIIGGFVERCNGIVHTKRELTTTLVKGLVGDRNRTGFLTLEVGTGLAGVGRELRVEGCVLTKNESRAIEGRANAKVIVRDSRFTDFGWDIAADNGTSVAGTKSCISFNGANEGEWSDNTFELDELTANTHIAVVTQNATIDGVPYTAGQHYAHHNTYRGLDRAVLEGVGSSPSTYLDEWLDEPVGSSPATWWSGLVAGSIARYRVNSSPTIRTRTSQGNLTEGDAMYVALPAGKTLTEVDAGIVWGNAGATARTDFTLPGAQSDLIYRFLCMDTDGLRVIAAAGDQIRSLGVASVAAGRVDNVQVGAYIELRGVDTTNWIATVVSGTWTVT